MNYSNTAVLHTQKLEEKPFMSRKKLQNIEQNMVRKKRIAGKKNRWKKSKIGSDLD